MQNHRRPFPGNGCPGRRPVHGSPHRRIRLTPQAQPAGQGGIRGGERSSPRLLFRGQAVRRQVPLHLRNWHHALFQPDIRVRAEHLRHQLRPSVRCAPRLHRGGDKGVFGEELRESTASLFHESPDDVTDDETGRVVECLRRHCGGYCFDDECSVRLFEPRAVLQFLSPCGGEAFSDCWFMEGGGRTNLPESMSVILADAALNGGKACPSHGWNMR